MRDCCNEKSISCAENPERDETRRVDLVCVEVNVSRGRASGYGKGRGTRERRHEQSGRNDVVRRKKSWRP
jgi:hypothetical protein